MNMQTSFKLKTEEIALHGELELIPEREPHSRSLALCGTIFLAQNVNIVAMSRAQGS
ncbi:hypothetical protein [Sinorhizobium sp. GL28]|uniref:hypothetical protein n=1 Tax=Sinorhizobium sp. GL28 TaxID=1358418 RepID=UPI000726D2B3|nr:hypothetical protein [Sinorhizobium sp. GL28]KSV83039.1 hypothetical protein N184_35085 [Sinorhizobium sp. GL28]